MHNMPPLQTLFDAIFVPTGVSIVNDMLESADSNPKMCMNLDAMNDALAPVSNKIEANDDSKINVPRSTDESLASSV